MDNYVFVNYTIHQVVWRPSPLRWWTPSGDTVMGFSYVFPFLLADGVDVGMKTEDPYSDTDLSLMGSWAGSEVSLLGHTISLFDKIRKDVERQRDKDQTSHLWTDISRELNEQMMAVWRGKAMIAVGEE